MISDIYRHRVKLERRKKKKKENFADLALTFVNFSYPVQRMISGPSKEKGSESSGSERMT